MNPESMSRALAFPILAGALRGYRWAPAAGGKVGRYFAGTYEADQTAVFCERVGAGDTVVDLGANIGYYTLLASHLVGPTGRVLACEPEPLNASYLRRHVSVNRLENVDVREVAVGDRTGEVRFTRGKGRGRGHISDEGELTVPLRRLDDIIGETGLAPDFLKIDVEGAEADVFAGGTQILRTHRPVIFLATHGRDVHEAACGQLRDLEYTLSSMDGRPFAETRKVLAEP